MHRSYRNQSIDFLSKSIHWFLYIVRANWSLMGENLRNDLLYLISYNVYLNLKVSLGEVMEITRISTQGLYDSMLGSRRYYAYVISYMLEYSNDGMNWTPYIRDTENPNAVVRVT